MHRSNTKYFRLTVVSRRFGLVSHTFLAEAALFLHMLQITLEYLIYCFIATCHLLPPLWSHLCTPPSQIYCYGQSFLIVATFALGSAFPCADDLLLLSVPILYHVENVFNQYDGCIMVP